MDKLFVVSKIVLMVVQKGVYVPDEREDLLLCCSQALFQLLLLVILLGDLV